MWSGPRNISTALMRSFENRHDCLVVDEPLYARYLHKTGLNHPGREAVLASQPLAADAIIEALMAPLPKDVSLQYQKHMSHHFLPDTPADWLKDVTSCFLLRDPKAMIASYVKSRPDVTLSDLGLPQLADLFDRVADQSDTVPMVIDSDDLLAAPDKMLKLICDRLGIAFSPKMLAWPIGPRDSDGAWAPWWYERVEKSSGFETRKPFEGSLPPEHEEIAEQAMILHRRLSGYKLSLDVAPGR